MAKVITLGVFTHTADGRGVYLTAGDDVPALANGEVERLTAIGAITVDAPVKPSKTASAASAE